MPNEIDLKIEFRVRGQNAKDFALLKKGADLNREFVP
jgi:hypothetical protein